MSNEFENEKREWVYDAFISYRHIQPDAFVAGSLHKILEAYKPPKSIFKGKNPEEIKRTKIKKVFRDEEELPLTSNLSDTIGYALENSEYLIAICSPRFGESLWCRKEVDTFIKLHGKEKVLTVLVEGEPSDSFPEELLYREVEITKPDGTTEIVKEPMEPLAANARGNSDKERVKLLKNESLRLMAPMFGVNFDDLKQRHREQKLRRTIRIVAAASAICLLFGIVSTTMAVKINNQNEQITQQNEQITQQNEQISLQADEIERQYEEALVSECTVATDLAISQLNAGNRIAAVKTAYDVFEQDGTDNIYMQKTEKVLSDALELYDDGVSFNPDRILEASSVIEYACISPNGERIAALDSGKNVIVWDSTTGEKLFSEYMGDSVYSYSMGNIVFRNDSQLYAYIQNELVLYDIDKGEIVYSFDTVTSPNMSYNAAKDRLLVDTVNEFYLIDGSSGKILEKHEDIDTEAAGTYSYVGKVSDISDDETEYYAYFYGNKDNEKNQGIIVVRRLDDGRLIKLYNDSMETVNKLVIKDDSLFISDNELMQEYFEVLDNSFIRTRVRRYDFLKTSNKPVWTFSEQGEDCLDLLISDLNDYVACIYYSEAELLSFETGESIRKYTIGTGYTYARTYDDINIFTVVSRDGKCVNILPQYADTYQVSFFVPNSSNIKSMDIRGGHVITVPYTSTEVTVYRQAPKNNYEELTSLSYMISKVEKKDDSKLLIYTYDNRVSEFDLSTKQVLSTTETEGKKTNKEEEKRLEGFLDDLEISKSMVNERFLDNDGKFFFVVYWDNSFEVYRMGQDGKPNSKEHEVFNNAGLSDVLSAQISNDGKSIWISGLSEGIILNANGESFDKVMPAESMITTHIASLRYVDFDNEFVYCSNNETLFRYPLYSKEEIGEIARQQLLIQ